MKRALNCTCKGRGPSICSTPTTFHFHIRINKRSPEPGEGSQVSRRTAQSNSRHSRQWDGFIKGSFHGNALSMGNKQEWSPRPMILSDDLNRAMILSASWRCDGIAPLTGVLEWVDRDSLGRTGREDENVSPSVSVISRRALDLNPTLGWVASWPMSYLTLVTTKTHGGWKN